MPKLEPHICNILIAIQKLHWPLSQGCTLLLINDLIKGTADVQKDFIDYQQRIPCVLVDSHNSRLNLEFWEYIVNTDHKWTVYIPIGKDCFG